MWENKLSFLWNGLGRLAVSRQEEINEEIPDLGRKTVDKKKERFGFAEGKQSCSRQ